MHSIHFHICMLDNERKHPAIAIIPKASSLHCGELLAPSPSSEHPPWKSPINMNDVLESPDRPATH